MFPFSSCSDGRLNTLKDVRAFSSLNGVNVGGFSAWGDSRSCWDLARSCVGPGFALGIGLPWSSVNTSLRGANGTLLAGVNTLANTGSWLLSGGFAGSFSEAFSPKRLFVGGGTVSFAVRTTLGVRNGVFCSASTNGVNCKMLGNSVL